MGRNSPLRGRSFLLDVLSGTVIVLRGHFLILDLAPQWHASLRHECHK